MAIKKERGSSGDDIRYKIHLNDEIGQHPFRLFVAPWKTDTLPSESWHSTTEKRKPIIRSFVWAPVINPFMELDSLRGIQIAGYQPLMESLAKHNLQAYEVRSTFDVAVMVSRQQILTAIADTPYQPGDSLVIFYYGFGISHPNAGGLIEPVFYDDTKREPESFSFWNAVIALANTKAIHVAVIMDLIATHPTPHPITIPGIYALNNLVFLRSPAPVFKDGALIPEDNFFSVQLTDIITTAGGKLRYDNLATTLTLRYAREGRAHKPDIISFGDNTLRRYILSGVPSGKSGYLLQHDPSLGWIINGGAANGINASSIFMDTVFELENGKHVFVDKVFPSHCTLKSVDITETTNVYSARLVQNAFPKIKVAVHKDMSKDMKQRLLETLDDFELCFTELIEDYPHAKYVIREVNGIYSVSRDFYSSTIRPESLLFEPEDNAEQLFRNLESLGKWEAVLEMQNVASGFRVQDLDIIIEPIEGIDCDMDDLENLTGPFFVNPDSVTIQVRNTFDPYIKCYLPDAAKLNNYHAQFLYLDNGFAISSLPVSPDTDDPEARPFARTQAHVDEFYLERQQSEATDYLLLFLSANEMNLAPLTQYTLGHQAAKQQNVLSEAVSDVFVMPEGDWTVRKIPIRVRHNVHTFKEYVLETTAARPVIVPNDLHKNRWGGRSKKNGFSLHTIVTKSSIPMMYNVVLMVLHDNMEPDGGDVAFLLHDSFSPAIRYTKFNGETAEIEVTAYEDFTAAAILYDGTELELDLSELPDLPDKFYADSIPDDFKTQVQNLLKARPPVKGNEEDLHKGRWDGMSSTKRYNLSASVEPAGEFFKVTLTLNAAQQDDQVMYAAFLLHDSFPNPVRYKRIGNGKATCIVLSYEAFTAAAILADGTLLELDLNDRTLKYPEQFYYIAETAS